MQVRTTRMGFCHTFLLGPVKNRYLLIDAGVKGKEKKFFSNLKSWNIPPEAIDYIIITHAHHDHIGALHPIKEATGARVIIHEKEAPFIEKGIITIPKGFTRFGKIMSSLGKRFMEGNQSFKPVKADIIVSQGEQVLDEYGFPLAIIHTPGHTAGSVSVIDKSSQKAFVGDAMFNVPVLPAGKIHPPFTDDATLLPTSWESLLNYQVKYYYPAHGKRIPRSLLKNELSTRKTSIK